ncbi:SIMPL domain-containing protein [Candidatus Parcubacteria bacterium]|nr:SIMPL domain-containing protein [Candidatus Parcubacteria bacterium]
MFKHFEGVSCPIKWVFKGAMIALLLALTVFVIFKIRNTVREFGYIGRAPLSQYTINISGEGKVSSVPDIAAIDLGVTSEATTVKQAQDDNTKKMNDIVKAIKDLGVDEKDIQTTNYNIYPKYNYDQTRGTSSIVGYTVSQSATIKIRELDKVGSILGKAGELGANQVGGVQFTIDKPESLKSEAREMAIKDAKDKAEMLAKELGVNLGRVVSFNEYTSGASPIYAKSSMEAYGLGGGSPIPDIQAGSQEVVVDVNLVFEIR